MKNDNAPRYRVVVAEMDDAYGPRARADRPNVVIHKTIQEPAAWFAHFRTTDAGRLAVRLRDDLTRNFGLATKEEATRQEKKLRRTLKRRGFAVNGDHTVWLVYVGSLTCETATSAQPRVYVGQSSHPREARWQQHLDGARNKRGPLYSRAVHRSGGTLMPELYKHLPACFTQEDAEALEKRVAEELRSAGYEVEGGH